MTYRLATYLALKVDLAILALGAIVGTVVVVADYRGGCPTPADGRGTCSSAVGLISEVIFSLVFWLFYYWWISLPVLALPIIIGIAIDLFGERAVTNSPANKIDQ